MVTKEQRRAYRQKNAKKVYQDRREWQRNNRDKVANMFLKKKYGITLEQQEQMFVEQCGKCAICGKDFSNRKEMNVDHNHTTGQIRQLLCAGCNRGIGFFNEDVSKLLKAIDYLKKWGKNSSVQNVQNNDLRIILNQNQLINQSNPTELQGGL